MNDAKSMIKNALILFVITLVAGVLLGLVYQVTKDPIAYQEKLAQDKANQSVFATATTFNDVELDEAAAAQVATDFAGVSIESVNEAKDASGNGFIPVFRRGSRTDKIVFTNPGISAMIGRAI